MNFDIFIIFTALFTFDHLFVKNHIRYIYLIVSWLFSLLRTDFVIYLNYTVQQSLEKQEFRNLEFKRQQMENHWKTIRNFWQYYYYKKLDF